MGGRGRRISEVKASLVYEASSRTAKATQRNPVLRKQKETKKKFMENGFKKEICTWMRLLASEALSLLPSRTNTEPLGFGNIQKRANQSLSCCVHHRVGELSGTWLEATL